MIEEAITPYTRLAAQLGGTARSAGGCCILGVRCCWAFGSTSRCVYPCMQWVCPNRKSASVMFWQKISQVYFPDTLDFVWGDLRTQYIINYILEYFLGQIQQHSCTVHKRLCYPKYADYSVLLWFWLYTKCQPMSSENKFILMQLITQHWKKRDRLMLPLHKFFIF